MDQDRWRARLRMKGNLRLAGLLLLSAAAPAVAGPPYLTDDPVPTDTAHWEIYAFTAGDGRRSTLDGEAGLDLNYGPVKNFQLTATLPLGFSHEPGKAWSIGTGDVELGVKYRFLNDERSGISAAIFPRAILPTSTLASSEGVRVLLPVWIGKDFAGGTSLFGGGGYEINPGSGNRNFWQAAIALTHDVSDRLSVGAEVARQGPDTTDATAQTRAGVGSIVKLSGHEALLVSGGPTWTDGKTGYHVYAALGLFF
jgi:hypothetical protein